MALPLRLDSVTKRYGETVAVDGVSFTAEPGRLFGLLGPNGAGKTTTLRMIAYVTTPDAGRVALGDTTAGPETQRRMGYLPEERGLYRKLRVGEQLVYLARLKGLSAHAAEASARRWLDRFGAASWWGRATEELSKGMQQKVQFVATVAHDPDLVVLDEPFSGLDPTGADLLTEIVAEMRAAGKTVVFASHRMESVEALCDDVCLIAGGRAVLSGPLRDVKRRFGDGAVTVSFSDEGAWLDGLVAAGAVRLLSRRDGHAEARLLGSTPARAVLDAALAGAADVTQFAVHEPPLADIFRQVVGQQAAEGERGNKERGNEERNGPPREEAEPPTLNRHA